MRSKQYPYNVNVLRKRVNLLSEGRQTFPGERVNFFRMGKQMLKKRAQKESTLFRKRQFATQQHYNATTFRKCICNNINSVYILNIIYYYYNI